MSIAGSSPVAGTKLNWNVSSSSSADQQGFTAGMMVSSGGAKVYGTGSYSNASTGEYTSGMLHVEFPLSDKLTGTGTTGFSNDPVVGDSNESYSYVGAGLRHDAGDGLSVTGQFTATDSELYDKGKFQFTIKKKWGSTPDPKTGWKEPEPSIKAIFSVENNRASGAENFFTTMLSMEIKCPPIPVHSQYFDYISPFVNFNTNFDQQYDIHAGAAFIKRNEGFYITVGGKAYFDNGVYDPDKSYFGVSASWGAEVNLLDW